jgi:hypothetical protein
MASPFQQQSLRRKVAYFVLIAVLFTVALIFKKYSIEPQATQLEVREQSLGEVELTDKALRLTLTGSRGLAVCGLWYAANEKQKKHEWNEVELLVRSLIKLQPHFVTPWLFQSWNLAYNVSVECDRVKDKYFYVTRGIELLAEGDRQNRDNADMRFYVGIYTQNKMGISDEANTMRSLFQMSCMDPLDRNPARFRRPGTSGIDWDQFEDFCMQHPQLVRRLHDHLRCKTPDDIIDFLAANQKLPSRFDDRPETRSSDQSHSPLMPLAERFPVLPPHSKFDPNDLTYDSDLTDDIDNYAVARAWFGYAQDPLLEPLLKHPRYMSQPIFEGYPARGQAYVGERLEKEGWFDTDGWEIRDWFPDRNSQSEAAKRVVTVGNTHDWGVDAWERAFQLYERHGREHGLLRALLRDDKEIAKMSREELQALDGKLTLTNFPHFYYKTDVERRKETVTARKFFFKADQQRKAADRDQALATYERPEAFPAWRKILVEHPEFRLDDDVQEETYVMQRRYQALVRDRRAPTLKRLLVLQDLLTQRAIPAPAVQLWVPIHLVPAVNVAVRGPFDGSDQYGNPLLTDLGKARATSSNHMPPEPPAVQPYPQSKPAASGPAPAAKPGQ